MQGRRVTIKDVAAAAGVQPSTVSKALHHNRGSEAVRRRVADAATRLGYRPDERGRALRRQESRSIGLLVPDLANPVFLPLLRGVEQTAQARGYVVLIADGQRSAEAEAQSLARLYDRGVDGIVLAGPVPPAALELFTDHAVPVVPTASAGTLARRSERSESEATAAMADRLLELGHRHVCLVVTPVRPEGRHARSRFGTLANRLEAHDATLSLVSVDPAVGYDQGVAMLVEFLATEDATAIVCANHLVAPWLLVALDAGDVRVPQDVSVVVYGDSDWAKAYRPPLDVIAHDAFLQGQTLASALLDSLAGRPTSAAEPAPYVYVQRGSCAGVGSPPSATRSRSRG